MDPQTTLDQTYLEEDEVHGGVDLVVVLERVDEQLVEVGVGGDRQVLGVADAGREVAEHERRLEDVGLAQFVERLLHHLARELVEHLDVGRVDELVAVDAARLVDVQADQVDGSLAAIGIRKHDALPMPTKPKVIKKQSRHSSLVFCAFRS